MQYIRQALYIFGFSFLGEVLNRLVPLPIPASVYGLTLLFTALCRKWIRLEQVKDAGGFLTSILPILFISPAVGIMEDWMLIRSELLSIALLLLGTTALTFVVSGRMTQWILKKGGAEK